MPEVSIQETPLIQVLRQNAAILPLNDLGEQKLLQFVENFDEKIIGYGLESIVISISGKPERVIAIAYRGLSPEQAKTQFYFQRIMSTLFPHNFPHFYAAFAGNALQHDGKVAGTVREKIDTYNPTTLQRLKDQLKIKIGVNPIKHPFKKVKEQCSEMGIPLEDIFYTLNAINFIVGVDGGEYYIDNLGHFAKSFKESHSSSNHWGVDRIINFMNRNDKYTSVDKKIVQASLQRLQAILTE